MADPVPNTPLRTTPLHALHLELGGKMVEFGGYDMINIKGEYELSGQFGEFDAVQMGSLILGQNGWEFAEVGVGFNGDFNMILENFS